MMLPCRVLNCDRHMGKMAMLEKIISSLKDNGATEAKLIPVNNVIVDERVRLKCQIPLCDSYNRNLMCPPNVPDVTEFRQALSLYSRAILIQISASMDDVAGDVFVPANKLHELVNMGEKAAFEAGYRFAAGLIGGCCRLCDECVAVNPGVKCRFPFKARPSMEAMGIDVIATVEKVGLPVSFPIGESVTWTGLILVD
jgi:predicted metal-binding protein